ncbi:MAG: hypothetical protein F6J94_18615 [Moorea sp. SIO1F2]|uniref:hypothetical protein n=2 Tax=Moorena TaxID=1155738 RepID=UPI0013B90833|nr:hypothetical protein [Moorena sp. SIO1F2]NET83861.1 hypothetical protein [Moorena sp. SIO1F2]
MSFDSYKTIGEVLQEFTITATEANYILETDTVIREAFKEDLEFCLREFTVEESEYAICETIIFPLLKEVYRQYRDKFTLWSHKPITYDQQLTGIPDYILAKRSPLGKQIFEKPYFVAVEAKKDDFIKGWGQCLAEMIAIQKLNDQSEQTIFGIVSNGQLWQFGKLKGNLYTREINNYTISDLERLYSAINYVFSQCELELENQQ